jgi:dienelactone hydrolase
MNLAKSLLFSTVLNLFPLVAQQAPEKQPKDALLQWMDEIAQKQLQKRENAIAEIHSVGAAEQRKQVVREKMLEILGGLPRYQGPLNARITGQIHSDGYTIEKLIYESLPGVLVTANLYRPNQAGRYPAVLLQSGHTQEGKAEPQKLAANLALKGFVALAFDPVGQGEREETYDPLLKAPAAGWSVNEHIQAGEQSMLVGESVARYFIWDAKRSLDYLVSRPDVDATRLGAAGCSGGGALTTFIGALDSRVKAVIPACFPTSYRLLFAGPDPDSEMSWPHFIAAGLDTADFVELSAPTPWLLQATEHDYFTPPGVKLVYEEARRWYRLYGAEEKVGFFVGPGSHGSPVESREAVYQWMIRWLKDGRGDFHEQPVPLYVNHDLLVTPTGRVHDEPGSRRLYQLILDDLKAKRKPETTSQLQTELRRLNIPTDRSAPVVQVLDEQQEKDFKRQHIRYESEPGIEIEGQLYLPLSPGRKTAVLLVSSKVADSIAERIVKTGRISLTVSPRDSPGEDLRRPYLGNWQTNLRADQIGLNLPAMRAHDILRAVDLLCARSDVAANSIRAAAQGVKGIWLLLAAATDTRIGKIWVDKTPYSMHEALQNPMNTDLFDAVIPGFALHWDLVGLKKAMGDRSVLWTDPTNWMGRPVWLGQPYRYRYVLGDMTDASEAQDNEYAAELMK